MRPLVYRRTAFVFLTQDGLLLWLDASAETTLEQAGGVLKRWHDRRSGPLRTTDVMLWSKLGQIHKENRHASI